MINLTKAAADQILKSFDDEDKQSVLRIAIKQNQQGEFQYLMGLDEVKAEDIRFISHDVRMVVDTDQAALVDKMEIDFVEIKEGENRFIFKNPNDPNYQEPTD